MTDKASYNRDLKWLAQAPVYLASEPNSVNPQDIFGYVPKHLEPPSDNKRLGFYYEDLVYELLKTNKEIDCIHKNVQVFENDSTLGEFDFLIHRKNLGWLHLEVAVKFYLAVVGEGITQFIGPNAKDQLHIKLNKMLGQQLHLSITPGGQKKLRELGIANIKSGFLMQGYVFIHPFQNELLSLSEINPELPKGLWVYKHELKDLNLENQFLAVIPKLRWLSLYHCSENELVRDISLLLIKTPFLLAVLRENENNYMEQSRIMIVGDNWPD